MRFRYCTLAFCVLLALMLLVAACDKSDPTAPDQSTVTLSANPTSIDLRSTIQGRSTITARVKDHDGEPVSGVKVIFSVEGGGSLSSGSSGVTTDSNGQASTTLTVHQGDGNATVTGEVRGAGSDSVDVTVLGSGVASLALTAGTNPVDLTTATSGTSVMTATFLDGSGQPVANANIHFTTNGGTLSAADVLTNAQGVATSTLTVARTNAPSVTVTARESVSGRSKDQVVNITVANQAPNGTITAPAGNPANANVGVPVAFTATGTDPDNDTPLTFHWDFGGGATSSTLQNPSVTFSTAATFTVTLTVTDSRGLADPTPDTKTVIVNP